MTKMSRQARNVLKIASIIAIGLLATVAAATWIIFDNANKKAIAVAEKYDKDLSAYIDQIQKAKTVAELERKVAQLPNVEKVTFGEHTEKYRAAQSKRIVENAYREYLAATLKYHDDMSFDTELRELDAITQMLPKKESDAETKARDAAETVREKTQSELLALYSKGDFSKSSKKYLTKNSEVKKAELAIAIDPIVAKYTVRTKALEEYQQRLATLPTNRLVKQYKQAMVRATDMRIALLHKLTTKVKNVKTPGEAKRLEHSYESTYKDAELAYYDVRWAMEEIFYTGTDNYASYIIKAMKYIASDSAIPTETEEAKLYGDVIYYGHLASEIVSAHTDKLPRTSQAKIRFGLSELQHSIADSQVMQEIKDTYSERVAAASRTVNEMPGDRSYEDSSAPERLHDFMSFVDFLDNYIGVSYGKSVVDSEASEAMMQREAKGIHDYYDKAKKNILPKAEYGKVEREAFIKQLDTCMKYRFGYYNQWISDSLVLAKITDPSKYLAESTKLRASRDKLVDQYGTCYRKASKLYSAAKKHAETYAGYRTLAIKQLAGIK